MDNVGEKVASGDALVGEGTVRDLNELNIATASFRSDGAATGMKPPGIDLSTYSGGNLYRVKLGTQDKPELETGFVWPDG